MTAVTSTVTLEAPPAVRPRPRPRTGGLAALATLARRRMAISAHTPRELLIPLLAPLLFAMVVVPALADTFGTSVAGIDYMSFVAVATIGLLVPLSAMQSGLGVVVDRLGGGLRDLLAAPVSRPVIVAGNLVVAVALSSLQVAVLLGAAALRGAEYDLSATGVMWFVAATLGFAVAMYGAAEVLANRLPTQEEYIGALPPVAIVPFFFAGSFFPISALPAGLTVIGKLLPITHVLALAPLRARRPYRGGPPRHLGHDEHHRHGHAQPRGRRPVRPGPHRGCGPHLPAHRRPLSPGSPERRPGPRHRPADSPSRPASSLPPRRRLAAGPVRRGDTHVPTPLKGRHRHACPIGADTPPSRRAERRPGRLGRRLPRPRRRRRPARRTRPSVPGGPPRR